MNLPRRRFLRLTAGAAALPGVSDFAWAQTYPSRRVCIIVGFLAGGAAEQGRGNVDVQCLCLVQLPRQTAHRIFAGERWTTLHGVNADFCQALAPLGEFFAESKISRLI
jgi:hypothetical protein